MKVKALSIDVGGGGFVHGGLGWRYRGQSHGNERATRWFTSIRSPGKLSLLPKNIPSWIKRD